MSGKAIPPSSWTPVLLKAFVVLLGLSVHSILSTDSSISYSLILTASIALLARLTGLLEKPWAKLQLSLLATVFLALYLIHGYGSHFDDLSFPIIIATLALLAYFFVVSISLPRVRLFALPIGLVVYVAFLRSWYPGILPTFESETYSWVLFLLAWESLQSSIHSNRPGPTISETATALAFVFFHYQFYNAIILDATFTVSIILSFFLGAIVLHNQLPFARRNAKDILLRGPFSISIASSYAIISLATVLLTAGSAWLLYSNSKHLPIFDSLRIPKFSIAFEQKQPERQLDPNLSSPNSSAKANSIPETNTFEIPINYSNESQPPESPTKPTIKVRPKIIVKTKDTSRKGDSAFNGFELETTPARTLNTRGSPVIRQIATPSNSQPNIYIPVQNSELSEKMNAPADSLDLLDFSLEEFSANPSSSGGTASASNEIQSTYRPSNSDPTSRQPEFTRVDSNSINRKNNASTNSDLIRTTIGPSGSVNYANDVALAFDMSTLMVVLLPKNEAPPKSLYLRLNTLEELKSNQFGKGPYNSQFDVSITGPNWIKAPIEFRSNARHDKTWTFATLRDWSGEFPIPNSFESIQISNTETLLVNTQHRSLRTAQSTHPFAYRLRGVNETQSARGNTRYSHIDNLTAPLDKKEIDYLRTLSRKIGSSAESRVDLAIKIKNHLSRNHPYQYDFSIRKGQEHFLIRWLKTKSPGICGYYAGAFVLLTRAQGIPSRVVTGLHTSEYSRKKHSFTVRRRDAHAWVEYQDENSEWIRFDPTPSAKENPRYTYSNQSDQQEAPTVESLLTQFQSIKPSESDLAKVELIAKNESTSILVSNDSEQPIHKPIVASNLDIPNAILNAAPELHTEYPSPQAETTPAQNVHSNTPIEQASEKAPKETVSDLILEQTRTPTPTTPQAIPFSNIFNQKSWLLEYTLPVLILLLSSIRFTHHLSTNRTKSRAATGRSKFVLRAQSKIDRILVQLDTLTSNAKSKHANELIQARSLALSLRYGPRVDSAFFRKTLKQLNSVIRASTRD